MLISPAEPEHLRMLGHSSWIPETFGADFLFTSDNGVFAVQRKTIHDLLASIIDGRLQREIPLLHTADAWLLMIEGHPTWTSDGNMLQERWTRKQWDGLLLSLVLAHVPSIIKQGDEVPIWLRGVDEWWKKGHTSLTVRPKDDILSARDFAVHLLQSFDGIGPKTAGEIFDHFGRVPLRWTVTSKELQQVKGIGARRAKMMFRALGEEH